MEKKIVLFDFDGVIIDSFEGAFKVEKIFEPALTREWMRKRFDGNINDSLFNEQGRVPTEDEDNEFYGAYVPVMMKCKIFPGMPDVMKSLSENYPLIIVSSTITSPIREYMEEHRVAGYFKEIMGNDVHKSKVEKIKMVFDKYGAGPDGCVFITDTLGDIREAEKTGVKSIAVTWGFHDRETLARGNPIVLVNKPEELPIEIEKYFETIA